MKKELENYEATLKELNIVKFRVRINVNVLKSVKRIMDNEMPIGIRERFQINQASIGRNLRSNNKFKQPLYLSDKGQKSFLYIGIKEFNKFQEFVKNTT